MSDAMAGPGEVVGEGVVLCPECGYDLSGTTGDRCSECGLAVDRAALTESGVPWAHRGSIGGVKAFVRTVWGVVSKGTAMAGEMARAQRVEDGVSFRRRCAAVVAAGLIGAWVFVVQKESGLVFLAYGGAPYGALWGGRAASDQWLADLLLPWSAAVTRWWCVPICLAMLAVYMTGVQQAVFHVGRFPVVYRRRVGAMGNYAAAPLVLLLPAVLCVMGADAVPNPYRGGPPYMTMIILALVGAMLALAGVFGTLWRVGRWAARARHAGFVAALLAALELVLLWGLGAGLFLGVVPWAAGFFLVLVDSFR